MVRRNRPNPRVSLFSLFSGKPQDRMSPDHAPCASAQSPALPRVEPPARPADGVVERESRLRIAVLYGEPEPLPQTVLLNVRQQLRSVLPGEKAADVERAPAEAVGLPERPEVAGRFVQDPIDGQRLVDETDPGVCGGVEPHGVVAHHPAPLLRPDLCDVAVQQVAADDDRRGGDAVSLQQPLQRGLAASGTSPVAVEPFFAVEVPPHLRVDQPAFGVALQPVDLPLQLSGVAPVVVPLAERHVLAGRISERSEEIRHDAQVGCGRNQSDQVGMSCCVRFADRPGRIRRAVFADRQIDPNTSLLGEHSLDSLRDEVFLVVGGHADRYGGMR